MDLHFNIIFIPHSVKYLQYGVLSLLRYCDYQFRLIANGLGRAEYRILERLVEGNSRLSLFGKPGGKLILHGDMLNTLLEQSESDWFCFMDNDVFAIAPFQSQIDDHLEQCDVFSFGSSDRQEEQRQSMLASEPGFKGSGSYMGGGLRTPGGLPFALTHLCVYPRQKLVDLVAETDVGFEHYAPLKSLPEIARRPDFPEDLTEVHKIDTGILMNMFASMRGWRFLCRDIPELVHIGNIAASMKRHQKWSKRLRSFLSRDSSRKTFILHDRNMEQELNQRIDRRNYRHGERKSKSPDEEREYVTKKIMGNRVATFFGRLFVSLVDGGAMPQIDLPEGDLGERITRTRDVLKEVVGESVSA